MKNLPTKEKTIELKKLYDEVFEFDAWYDKKDEEFICSLFEMMLDRHSNIDTVLMMVETLENLTSLFDSEVVYLNFRKRYSDNKDYAKILKNKKMIDELEFAMAIMRKYTGLDGIEIKNNFKEIGTDFKKDTINPSIYIIGNPINKNIKIGYSKDINSRRKTLETGAGSMLYVLYKSKPIKNAHEVERLTHNEFKNYKVFGEWFNFDFQKGVDYINKILKGRKEIK